MRGISGGAAPVKRRAAANHEANQEGIDIKGLFRFVARRRGLIFWGAVLSASSIFAIGMLQPTQYVATASVMIVAPRGDIVAGGKSAAAEPDIGFVDSQVEIIRSPSVIVRLVDRLRLAYDPAWNTALKPPAWWEAELLRRNIIQRRPPPLALSREIVIDKAAAAIKARRKGLSDVIEIAATSPNPNQSAAMANAVVDLFIETKARQRIETSQKANAWLSERLTGLKDDLQRKEAAVEAYKAESGLLTAEGALLTDQQIMALQGAIISARADLAEREAQNRQVLDLLAAGGSADSIAGSINSATIRELRAQESEVSQRQADLEARYGPAHPAIAQVRLERAGVETQIQAEIVRIAAGVKNEVEVARARVAALENTQAAMQAQMVSNNTESVKLRELEREAAATRGIYEQFLAHFQQATETETLKATDAYRVSDASPPTRPSAPQAIPLALFSVAIGSVLGIMAALLVDLADDGIDSAESMERKIGLAALASIPLVRAGELRQLAPNERRPPRYLVEKPMSSFAEGLRSLRTTIVYGDRDRQSKLICITSALPNEGKTTTSLCLARIAAMSGQRAIIVDCDLRRRSLNVQLDVKPKFGLLDCVLDGRDWRDLIIADAVTSLHILPAAEAVFTPRDIFGSAAMRALLDELRAAYDLIVLDCPPVLAIAETGMIARLADQTVVVARWSKTPAGAVRQAVERIERSGAAISGLALNCVDASARGKLSYGDIAYQSKYAGRYYAS